VRKFCQSSSYCSRQCSHATDAAIPGIPTTDVLEQQAKCYSLIGQLPLLVRHHIGNHHTSIDASNSHGLRYGVYECQIDPPSARQLNTRQVKQYCWTGCCTNKMQRQMQQFQQQTQQHAAIPASPTADAATDERILYPSQWYPHKSSGNVSEYYLGVFLLLLTGYNHIVSTIPLHVFKTLFLEQRTTRLPHISDERWRKGNDWLLDLSRW